MADVCIAGDDGLRAEIDLGVDLDRLRAFAFEVQHAQVGAEAKAGEGQDLPVVALQRHRRFACGAGAQETLGLLGRDDTIGQRRLHAGMLAAAGIAGDHQAQREKAGLVAVGLGRRSDAAALERVGHQVPGGRLGLEAQQHGHLVEPFDAVGFGSDGDAVDVRRQRGGHGRAGSLGDRGSALQPMEEGRLRPPFAARPQGDLMAQLLQGQRVLDCVVPAAQQQDAAGLQGAALLGQADGVQHAGVGRLPGREEKFRPQRAQARGQQQSACLQGFALVQLQRPARAGLPVQVFERAAQVQFELRQAARVGCITLSQSGERLARLAQHPVLLEAQGLQAVAQRRCTVDQRRLDAQMVQPGSRAAARGAGADDGDVDGRAVDGRGHGLGRGTKAGGSPRLSQPRPVSVVWPSACARPASPEVPQ